MNAIEITNLTKYYGSFKALDQINISIKQGEIHGFLGPNGAGKTSTCLLYTSPSPRDRTRSRMPSSA